MTDVNKLMNQARVRVNIANTPSAHREALGLLSQVLQSEPDNDEAYDLLEAIATKGLIPSNNVEAVLSPLTTIRAVQLLRQIQSPGSTARPAGAAVGGSVPSASPGLPSATQDQVNVLLEQLTQVYYEGKYQEAINLSLRVLQLDPNNLSAKEYQAKADDYLRRGVVAETRIPLLARTKYNRARSAIRASLYSEAQNLLEEALKIAQDEAGISRWADAESLLLEIADLQLAEELRKKGDDLAARDNWEQALEQYENSLGVVNTPRTQVKYDSLKKVIQLYQEVDIKLSVLSGQLLDKAEQIESLRADLAQALTYWPNSARLMELLVKLDARSRNVGAKLLAYGKEAFARACDAPSLRERLMGIQEALLNLEAASNLLSEDSNADTVRIQASTEEKRTKQAIMLLDEADKYMNLRDEASLNTARDKLNIVANDCSDFVQDQRYRTLLSKLQHYFLEEAAGELEHKKPNLSYARKMVTAAGNLPFNLLGRSHDVAQMHQQIDRLGLRKRLIPFAIAGGLLVICLIASLLSRPVWMPLFFPTPTATATATLTPTITPTDTPTSTNTPTLVPTVTPVFTPTPNRVMCLGVTKTSSYAAYYVYRNPEENADGQIGTVSTRNVKVDILDQTRDNNGRRWFKIDYGDEDTTQIGWILADRIVEVTTCPRLP